VNQPAASSVRLSNRDGDLHSLRREAQDARDQLAVIVAGGAPGAGEAAQRVGGMPYLGERFRQLGGHYSMRSQTNQI